MIIHDDDRRNVVRLAVVIDIRAENPVGLRVGIDPFFRSQIHTFVARGIELVQIIQGEWRLDVLNGIVVYLRHDMVEMLGNAGRPVPVFAMKPYQRG